MTDYFSLRVNSKLKEDFLRLLQEQKGLRQERRLSCFARQFCKERENSFFRLTGHATIPTIILSVSVFTWTRRQDSTLPPLVKNTGCL